MTYDALDRLTDTVSPMYGVTGAHYAYDVLDNITHVLAPGRDQGYCYNASNQLATIRTSTCSGGVVSTMAYDAQGNLSSKGTVGYAFDFGNRLRFVGALEGYRYDAHGRRVLAWSPTSSNIVSMYGLGGQLLFQANQRNQNVNLAYIYLAGSLVATRAQDTGTGAVTVTYQHTDALGSPVAKTNTGRTVIQRSEYEPYGKLLNRPMENGPGYTGHVADADTGLIYMQQRYYDPGTGSFLSVDPVSVDGTTAWNFCRYCYAANNPYKFTDPDGRTCTRAGSDGAYSCQIDKIATQAKGKTVLRDATAADHKKYKAVEKSLTQAVNAAATSGKTVAISVASGGSTFSFSISGANVAKNLAGRTMVVNPDATNATGAMNTVGNRVTNINPAGIDPTLGHPGSKTAYGDSNRTRAMEFLHEGIHGSAEEVGAFGKALPLLSSDSQSHQLPYNTAADALLGN